MAKPNYQFEKRQREQEKKKKKEEKAQKKAAAATSGTSEREPLPGEQETEPQEKA